MTSCPYLLHLDIELQPEELKKIFQPHGLKLNSSLTMTLKMSYITLPYRLVAQKLGFPSSDLCPTFFKY